MNNKLEVFFLKETDVVLFNHKKVRIEKTKKERLFSSFKDHDSISFQIISRIAENPQLIQFMFLESEPAYSLGSGEMSISFPLILDPSYDYKRRHEREDYKTQHEKLIARHSRTQNESFDLWKPIWDEWTRALASDQSMVRVLTERKINYGRVRKIIDNFFENNPKFSIAQSEQIRLLSHYFYEIQTLGKLQESSKIIKNAEKNCRSLHSTSMDLPHDKQQITSALSKLSKHADFSIESVCMDCWYEKDQLPFIAKFTNTKSVEIIDRCKNCDGTGIVHKINIEFPRSVNSLLLLDSSWLYEVIIGKAISKLAIVKQVYVHKKIQAYEEGRLLKGVEVDVIVITNDNKLYLIEVTKQADTSNIVKNITRKTELFKNAKIPFEKIMYFTSDDKDIHLDTNEARIFQIKHLPRLAKFVEEWISS